MGFDCELGFVGWVLLVSIDCWFVLVLIVGGFCDCVLVISIDCCFGVLLLVDV